MKQKKNILFKKILVPTTHVAGIFCLLGSLTSCSVTNFSPIVPQVEDISPVTFDLLDIDEENHVLKGFAPGVTATEIRQKGFNALQIPAEVVEIKDNAFAMMFDGKNTPIKSLIFDYATSLERIGDDAFVFCKGITSELNFSNTKLKSIGNRAFMFDSGISRVIFANDDPNKDTLQKIGQSAFQYCIGLKSDEAKTYKLILPSTLQEIGVHAFADVNSPNLDLDLSRYIVPPKWMSCSKSSFQNFSVGEALFNGRRVSLDDWKEIFAWQNDGSYYILTPKYKSATTKEDFEEYQDDDYNWHFKIKDNVDLNNYDVIVIPEEIQYCDTIEQSTLNSKIRSVNHAIRLEIKSPNITTIGRSAFYQCNALHSPLILPDTISFIDEYSFSWCTNLSGTFSLPNNSNLRIGGEAFHNAAINVLSIPDSAISSENIFKKSLTSDKVATRSFFSNNNLSFIDLTNNTKTFGWDKCQDEDEKYRTFVLGEAATIGKKKTGTLFFNSQFLEGYDNRFNRLKNTFEPCGWGTSFYQNSNETLTDNSNGTLLCDIGEPIETYDEDFCIDNSQRLISLNQSFYDNKDSMSVINIPNNANIISEHVFDKALASSPSNPYKIWLMNLPNGVVELDNKCLANNSSDTSMSTTGLLLNPKWPVTLKTLNNPFDGTNYLMNGCLEIPAGVEEVNGLGLDKTNVYGIRLSSTLKHLHSAKDRPDKGPLDFPSMTYLDLRDFMPEDLINFEEKYDWGDNALNLPALEPGQGIIYVKTGTLHDWADIFNHHSTKPRSGWHVEEIG